MERKNPVKGLRMARLLAFVVFSMILSALNFSAAQAEQGIQIDIPVKLVKANVVYNMDHLAFDGDMPVGLRHMYMLALHFKDVGTKGQIIGVFHGEAAYMTLNDKAYNAYRKVNTGNPFKGIIAEALKNGVQIEECAYTMKTHHWMNDNLLPGVKVHTEAIGRLIQLGQEGYVQIQP